MSRTDKLTEEGLFVGASLLHVGTRPDSTAAVMQLVHNSTTQKEDKRKDPGHTPTVCDGGDREGGGQES